MEQVLSIATEFDVIHNHLDFYGFGLAEESDVPVVSTLHGRTDVDPLAGAIRRHSSMPSDSDLGRSTRIRAGGQLDCHDPSRP